MDPKPESWRSRPPLSEANRSVALAEGRLKRWVALDQDPQSVGLIARDPARGRGHRRLGADRADPGHKLGKFDLIYASGLYDYLQHNSREAYQDLPADAERTAHFLFANYAEGHTRCRLPGNLHDWVLLLRSESTLNIVNASVDRNAVERRCILAKPQCAVRDD